MLIPDDEVISLGGTLAKYAREGKNIVCVIFSYGEISYLKSHVISVRRKRESEDAAKLLGYNNLIYLGLPDGKISSEIDNIKEKIKDIILEYNPIKIFTHSPNDNLPDHKAVNKLITFLTKELRFKEVYGFDVWNISNKKAPKLYVDVSDTFDLKIEAMKLFKSQRHVMLQFIPIAYARGKLAGDQINCKYAERFSKL